MNTTAKRTPRVNRRDTEGMVALAFQVATERGAAAYLQPTAYGWSLETSRSRFVGLGYLVVDLDGTVRRATLDGLALVATIN